MSPDEYIIADPCYVMPDKAYQAMVDSVFSSNNELDNVYVYKGKQMVVFGTAYGDGGYSNNINANSILVDSGLIACIPTSVLAKKSIKDNSKNSVVFTAKSSITCQNDDGILQYGAITVDTVDLANAIDDTTNDLLKRNADLLHTNSISTAKANQRSIIDVSTLEMVQNTLIKTVTEVIQIQKAGVEARDKATIRLKDLQKNYDKIVVSDSIRLAEKN